MRRIANVYNGKPSTNGHAAPTYHWRPRNIAQREALTLWANGCDVLFLLGPAGSGKTLAAVALAVGEVVAGRADGITLIRPAVEAGSRSLGHLPGDIGEKIDPYMDAYRATLGKVVYGFDANKIERRAIQYLRGLTFERRIVLLDEAQDATYEELTLVITRIGEGGRLIVLGDPEQPDVRASGLETMADALEDAPGIEMVEFTDQDIVRHPKLSDWVRRIRDGKR